LRPGSRGDSPTKRNEDYNNWVLTFFWELPLDKVALGDLIATENPLVLENLPPQ
jgi:hypothetical protein